jgi:hypothetical protein
MSKLTDVSDKAPGDEPAMKLAKERLDGTMNLAKELLDPALAVWEELRTGTLIKTAQFAGFSLTAAKKIKAEQQEPPS